MDAITTPAVSRGPAAPIRDDMRGGPWNRALLVPALAVCAVLAVHLHLVLTRSVNWDEFHYLGLVHQFTRGELTIPLQTLHVRLFAWLPGLDLSSVDQVVVGRLVMFGALVCTTASIVAVARRFTGMAAALICALAYLSFAFVIHHGTSFRADPLAAAMCMTALAILARARLGLVALIAASLLVGAAFMVTIKIVLYAPAFAGAAWLRWHDSGFSRSRALWLGALPILAGAVAGALFLLHSAELAPPDRAAEMIGHSGARMFGWSPNLVYAYKGAMMSLPFVVLLAAALAALARGGLHTTAERIALAGLVAPLATLVFYTNTFPYFYGFILPPVAAALAAGLPLLTRRYGTNAVAALLTASAALLWIVDGPSRQTQQRQIEAAVDRMFPEPVSYFDFPGFLPQHRKANFFITRWGMRNYREAGEPQFADTLAARTVPLLLAVELAYNPSLRAVLEGGPNAALFHPQDAAALRETYRRVWGPIYLAGTRLPAGASAVWTVRVPGTYTIEGQLTIDGRNYSPGSTVKLPRGKVALQAAEAGSAGLLWGDKLLLPKTPPPAEPYWTDF